MSELVKYLDSIGACDDAIRWAETQPDLATAWRNCDRADWMLWLLNNRGFRDERILRLIACDCADTVRHLLTDPRSREAIETSRRYANGLATKEELDAARAAARAAAWDAARDAARDAEPAARDAAGDAETAARDAAWAAWAAAWAAWAAGAAGAAARYAAGAAASAARDAWAAASAARDAAAWAAASAARGAASAAQAEIILKYLPDVPPEANR